MEAEDHQALPLLFSCRGVIGCSGDLELSTCGASAVPNGRCSLCAGLCARREFIRVFPLQLLSKSDPFPEIFPETQTPALGGVGGSGPGGESGFCLPAAAGAIVPSSCLCGSLSQALWPHVCPSSFTRMLGGTREDSARPLAVSSELSVICVLEASALDGEPGEGHTEPLWVLFLSELSLHSQSPYSRPYWGSL